MDNPKYIATSDFNIDDAPHKYIGKLTKEEGEKLLKRQKEKLHTLQEKLYADGSKSLLIILQAMDAAGKDSLVEHVFGGVNPQGCEVTSFKSPSTKEYAHDFLWRHVIALPEKGKIGIFNRSYYESVLVCKVHPEYNLKENVWKSISQFNETFWQKRYQSINDMERHLTDNGTEIVKIFLNVSKKEQKKRLIARIDEEDKNWKFSIGDLAERSLWVNYMEAYQTAIQQTSTTNAPWHIIPADNKWFARLAAIEIINQKLDSMDLAYPEVSLQSAQELKQAKSQLENE